jgi:uncharacterized damage-inducible protein DinB
MDADSRAGERRARRALSGKGSHVGAGDVCSGLDWKSAGAKPRGAPHSVYEILEHMSYWQDWAVRWFDGEKPAAPRHASGSWPAAAAPSSRPDWDEAVARFRRGLATLERSCRGAGRPSSRGAQRRLEMLHTIAAHNSYHAGQVAFLRQLLGKWPPPSGGVTW